MLHDIYKDVHFDIDAMMTATAREANSTGVCLESQDSPTTDSPAAGTSAAGTSSGSRKRSRSAATKSTAESPSKKTDEPSASPSSRGANKKLNLFAKLIGRVSSQHDKRTNDVMKLAAEEARRKEAEQQEFRNCLKLATEAGADPLSAEFDFFKQYLDGNASNRAAFLLCATPEQRMGWIHRVFQQHPH
ncbi:unnamed protein product [Urochloa decumbens]|uniref:Uncharacterized protein n=1 Tax=Urochloa decumbens TaxID=240449 RepID=A0ABC8WEM0_9POAL